MTANCFVCNRPADVLEPPDGTDAFDVSCPRCGCYRISGNLAPLDLEKYGRRYLISGVIRNLFEKGERLNLLTSNLRHILDSVIIPSDPFDIIDLLLEHVLNKTGKISNSFKIDHEINFPLLYLESPSDFVFFIKKANELDYIEYDSISSLKLALNGWKRLAEIKKKKPLGNQAFVAMWFSPDLSLTWEEGFKPALIETGYEPIRIDLQEHNEKICDRIISEIRKSGLVVADFTGQRGGVYFEAGLSLGLDIPVIWTCKETDFDNVHFDTRQYNHIVWKNPEDLKTKLVNRIKATLPLLR